MEPEPVDDHRLTKLLVAAQAILGRPDRHTPLELEWARQVLDLATALRQARAELAALKRNC